MDDATLRRFADLIVGFGANVQPGQIVAVVLRARQGAPGPGDRGERLPPRGEVRRRRSGSTRGSSARASSTRARRRSTSSADWHGERMLALGEIGAARDRALRARSRPACSTTSTPPASAATACPALKEAGKVVNDRTTNWTIVPCPTPAWAKLVFPDLDRARGARARSRSTSCTSAARRARPGRRLARARGHARRGRRAPDRAQLRRAALRGPGHRPDRRPAAERPLGGRALRDAPTASSTCRTSRPRRSSPRPTRRGSTARSPRPSRSC